MNGVHRRYKVVVHDDAAQMLYSHVRFLANVSIHAAKKLRTALFGAFASLENMPQRCPVYRTPRTRGTYRQLIVGRYQIVFSINEEDSTVSIHYILDSRQNNDI
jgi:plasmid stabilization system protein ParE